MERSRVSAHGAIPAVATGRTCEDGSIVAESGRVLGLSQSFRSTIFFGTCGQKWPCFHDDHVFSRLVAAMVSVAESGRDLVHTFLSRASLVVSRAGREGAPRQCTMLTGERQRTDAARYGRWVCLRGAILPLIVVRERGVWEPVLLNKCLIGRQCLVRTTQPMGVADSLNPTCQPR